MLISDYHLPEITAPEVFEILQQRQLNLPFIVISGKINESLAIELMRQGASDYLKKDNLKRLPESVRRGKIRILMIYRKPPWL
ncbi:MAG: response regulator [Pseudanabaena sp.]